MTRIQFKVLIVCMYIYRSWNDLNQLIKINDFNRNLNQMIFLIKKFDLNREFD